MTTGGPAEPDDTIDPDLQQRFEHACNATGRLPQHDLDARDLRFLYAHRTHALEGEVAGSRPGFFDPVGRARYDARRELRGLSRDEAMRKFIARVDELNGQ